MRHNLFILLLLATCHSSSLALPSDAQQPINIESDRAERYEKTGTTIYEGAVVITQGTIKIHADKVTVYTANNQVVRIVCVGEPARYQQQPNPNDNMMYAKGDTIEYHLASDRIYLLKNASVEQNGTVITGEKINYDLKAEVVKASSGDNPRQRIQMVIPPNKQKDAN